MVRAVTDRVPSPEEFDSPADREATERALHYMALEPGTPIEEIGIDRVLFAADWPFEPSKEAVEGIESAPLSLADKEKVFHTNAALESRLRHVALFMISS